MKRLRLGQRTGNFERWVQDAFRQIEQASAEDIEAVVAGFTVTNNLIPRRSLDASDATLAEVREFLATLVEDIQKRGQKRGYPED